MSNSIEQILELANADARAFELSLEIKRIPERLAEAKKHLDAEQIQFDEVNGPWSEAAHKIREKEATIQIALETIQKFEEHMARVNTQKEYMAAQKQVDEARRLNERLQNEILELRMKQEELGPQLEEVRGRYERVKEDYQQQEAVIQQEQQRLQGEIDGHEARIAEVAELVDPRVTSLYERLSRGKVRPAIVPVLNNTCMGCNMAMLPQAYNQLCAQNGTFFTCPNCHRMVFIPPPEEAPEEEAAADAAKANGGAESADAPSAAGSEAESADPALAEQPAAP